LKSRISLALLALLGLTTISSAFAPAPVYREPPKPKVPEVYALMQGTWEVQQNVNVAFKGRIGIRRTQKIRIKDGNWGYIFNNNGTEIESTKYQMVLDPKASPATLDLKLTNQMNVGPGGGGGLRMVDQVVMKGIIKVEGDTLTFCYVSGYQAHVERPKLFYAGNQVMPNGTTAMTMTLKRVK
jgi:uncharacterized protein (TIGR03067 family)